MKKGRLKGVEGIYGYFWKVKKPNAMTTIDNFDFAGRKALIRVDFNVPLDAEFQVADSTRIEAARPTIIKVLEDGGSAILMSHLGRPKGRKNPDMSLSHISGRVSEVLGVQVKFVPDCIGEEVADAVSSLKSGEVLLLENLTF